MSGHSKWSTIKRQKGVADAKRSQVFTKLANAISAAARGGADPSMNFKLRLAIDRARESNMPKDNIDRAVKRGAGGEEGVIFEEIRYEGYGPGGVAFLIDTLTNNRNRTGSSVRHILESHGGRFAEMGSVAWLFEIRGVVRVPLPTTNQEELELMLIEAGASDIKMEDEAWVIFCEPSDFENIKTILEQQHIKSDYANIEPVAKNTITVDDPEVQSKLNDVRADFEDDEDISDFYDNVA